MAKSGGTTKKRARSTAQAQPAELRRALIESRTVSSAGAATGIPGRVTGPFRLFNCGTEEVVSPLVAEDILVMGEPIAAPDAGPGAYAAVLASMGFKDVECHDSGSSAGDWSGTATTRRGAPCDWWQENRHPFHGFRYRVRLKGSSDV